MYTMFLNISKIEYASHSNVCYEKFVTHLLLYTVANVWQIFLEFEMSLIRIIKSILL